MGSKGELFAFDEVPWKLPETFELLRAEPSCAGVKWSAVRKSGVRCGATKWSGSRKARWERGAAQKNGARAKREQSRATHGTVKHGGKEGKLNETG